jgi:hypothetical protein
MVQEKKIKIRVLTGVVVILSVHDFFLYKIQRFNKDYYYLYEI